MYIYVKAILRSVAPNSKYIEVDIQSLTLEQIFKRYIDGYIELEHTLVDSNFYVPLKELREAILPQSTFTFNAWLALVANIALPTYDEPPVFTEHKVEYADAFQIGAIVKRVTPITLDARAEHPASYLKELLISIDGVEIDKLAKQLLISVNGYMHASYYDRRGLVVMGGGTSMDIAQNNQVGIHSFENVGEITVLNIKPEQVIGDGLKSNVILKFDVPIKNKKMILVLGGIMYIEDGVSRIIDHEVGAISIAMYRIDLLKQIKLARKKIDLTSLGLTAVPSDPEGVYRDEVYSDAVIRSYLSLKQSFVVLIDAPHLYASRELVGQTTLPGVYESNVRVSTAMVDTYGRIVEYIQRRSVDGTYILLTTPTSKVSNELYNTTSQAGLSSLYGANTLTGYSRHIGQAYFIGSQVMQLNTIS